MKERISSVIAKEGITAAQFAEKIGISASSLSHILSGRNNPSLEVVMKIHKACEYIQLNWLLYGEGQMMSGVTNENYNDGSFRGAESSFFSPNPLGGFENPKDLAVEMPQIAPKNSQYESIKYIEIPSKKITEIRIFFDNGTYETFRPESK